MKFIDREDELSRLTALAKRRDGGLAVVTGRRRVGWHESRDLLGFN